MADQNVIGWVEIAVSDMERAQKFYETVFDFTMEKQDMEKIEMVAFPWVQGGPMAGGALVKGENLAPSSTGTVPYFHSENLDTELARVEDAGGKIVLPRTSIGEHGNFCLVADTEGNTIGIHSMK